MKHMDRLMWLRMKIPSYVNLSLDYEVISPLESYEMGLILRCILDRECCTPLKVVQMIPLYLFEIDFRSLPCNPQPKMLAVEQPTTPLFSYLNLKRDNLCPRVD